MFKKTLALGAVIFLLSIGSLRADNILINGSFESDLTGWTVTGTNTGYPVKTIVTNGVTGSAFGEAIPADDIVGGSPDVAGTHGVYFVDDHAVQNLTQSVFLGSGSYEIGFDAYLPRNGYNNPGDATFDAAIASIQLADFSVKSNALPIQDWVHFWGLANVTIPGTYSAAFTFQTFGGASADVVIDRVYIVKSDSEGGVPINPVPEPASIFLLGAGVGSLGLIGFLRKRK